MGMTRLYGTDPDPMDEAEEHSLLREEITYEAPPHIDVDVDNQGVLFGEDG